MKRILAPVLLAAVALAGCGGPAASPGVVAESGPPLPAAITACQDAVKARLKAPGTAVFGDETATPAGESATVTGWVDSQNGFGALVRSRYTCKAWRGTGWRVEDVQFSDW